MDLPEWLEQLLTILGGVGAIVLAAAGVAYWIFQTFAKGWLDTKFSERLERLRHSQAVELENLRLEINKALDRSTKLLNKELEVLPTCWSLLDQAYLQTQRVCSSFRQSIDVDRMSNEQLGAILDGMNLLEFQKREIMEADNRKETYERYETFVQLHQAKQSYSEYHNFIVRSGVFVRPEISLKLDQVAKEIADALRLRQLMTEANMDIPLVRKQLDPALRKAEELHVEIRKDVQNLWALDRASIATQQGK